MVPPSVFIGIACCFRCCSVPARRTFLSARLSAKLIHGDTSNFNLIRRTTAPGPAESNQRQHGLGHFVRDRWRLCRPPPSRYGEIRADLPSKIDIGTCRTTRLGRLLIASGEISRWLLLLYAALDWASLGSSCYRAVGFCESERFR